jgi:L-malate glycosyltransferase
MKICILATTIPPFMGGLEVHVWELSKHLARKGHQVCLVGYLKYKGKKYKESEEKENVNIFRVSNNYILGGYTTYVLNASKKVVSLDQKIDFDIIHAHQAYPAGLAAKLASDKLKIPYINTSHGQEILVLGKLIRFKPFLRWTLRGARKVIGVSKELAEQSIKCGARRENTVILPNAVDIERFNPSIVGLKVREKYNILADKIVALSLRRLEPKTGVQYLIEAAKKIIPQFDKICFLITGEGYLKKELIEKTIKYNIRDYFIFTSSIDNQDIPRYIATSDFSIFPSLAEATSIACLEVMACGKPVIVSNVGGLPEIVDDGGNGLIVDFRRKASSYIDYGLSRESIDDLAEAILKLCKNKFLRMKLGQCARATVEKKYTWDEYIKKLEKIYEGVINESRTSEYTIFPC